MTDRQAKAVTMSAYAVIERKRREKAKQMIKMMQEAADLIFGQTQVAIPELPFPLDLIARVAR